MAELRDGLANSSFALTGEFRIGKTSIQRQLTLLLRQVRHPDYVFLPIFIDLQHLGIKDEDRFFYFLGTHLIEECRRLGISESVLERLSHSQCENEADYDSQPFSGDLEMLIKELTTLYHPRRPIVVFQIDEIALLKEFHPDTRLGLRAAFINQNQARVVLSGPYIPKLPSVDALSPWWNFFRELEIRPLTSSEVKRLIVQPVRGLFTYDPAVIEEITARAEGKPLRVQTLCAEIVRQRHLKRRWRKRLIMEDLQAALTALAVQRDTKEAA
jgi:hypothetical protein